MGGRGHTFGGGYKEPRHFSVGQERTWSPRQKSRQQEVQRLTGDGACPPPCPPAMGAHRRLRRHCQAFQRRRQARCLFHHLITLAA